MRTSCAHARYRASCFAGACDPRLAAVALRPGQGGVAFLAAAVDNYLRAYDLSTGRELWKGRLPAGGQATPMTYALDDGRQMVVIVAGGHGSIGTKPGDYVIAYSLP